MSEHWLHGQIKLDVEALKPTEPLDFYLRKGRPPVPDPDWLLVGWHRRAYKALDEQLHEMRRDLIKEMRAYIDAAVPQEARDA